MTPAVPARKQYSTAVERWAGIGPYYAMFPMSFAQRVVREYTRPGERVLDPFAGRATSVYAGATMGRPSVGIEINDVGWLYGRVKLDPARQAEVLHRLRQVGRAAEEVSQRELDELPLFFTRCFAHKVRRFLLAARKGLNWRRNKTDATLMAFVLVYLHGKRGQSLSNQTRQGKAMAPDYSVRWWTENNSRPPNIDPVSFLEQRILWRYAKGIPEGLRSRVIRGDSTKVVRRFADSGELNRRKFHLLFTSPPYYAVTNYHYDQWLRLWMLGGTDRPHYGDKQYQSRFGSRNGYERLLRDVFEPASDVLTRDATVYVRTDARQFTLDTTTTVLADAFPNHTIMVANRPFRTKTQTALYGDTDPKPGEVDIVLYRDDAAR